MTERHCNTDALLDGGRWICPLCSAWKWKVPRDEQNRWRSTPPIPAPKLGPRAELVAAVGAGEVYTALIARRLGKSRQSVDYMLKALERDGVLESRVVGLGRRCFVRKMRMWKVTGKPVPDHPEPTPRRAVREKARGGIDWSFDALMMVMK